MSINSAKEAREILDAGKDSIWPQVYANEWKAKGYLEALKGKEFQELERIMKGLVEAVEKLRIAPLNHCICGDGMGGMEGHGGNCLWFILDKWLTQYKESLHDR